MGFQKKEMKNLEIQQLKWKGLFMINFNPDVKD